MGEPALQIAVIGCRIPANAPDQTGHAVFQRPEEAGNVAAHRWKAPLGILPVDKHPFGAFPIRDQQEVPVPETGYGYLIPGDLIRAFHLPQGQIVILIRDLAIIEKRLVISPFLGFSPQRFEPEAAAVITARRRKPPQLLLDVVHQGKPLRIREDGACRPAAAGKPAEIGHTQGRPAKSSILSHTFRFLPQVSAKTVPRHKTTTLS